MFQDFKARYLTTWWVPALTAFTVLSPMLVNTLLFRIPFLNLALFLVFLIALFGIPVTALRQMFRGSIGKGILNLLISPIVAMAGLAVFAVTVLNDGESDNDFGKDIVIPPGMQLADPLERFDSGGERLSDRFTDELAQAFGSPIHASDSNGLVHLNPLDLKILDQFGGTNRQRLIQHLAASPRWFVTEDRGRPYAYRRLLTDGQFQNTLNGYYSGSAIREGLHFQVRIVIGFNGPVYAEPFATTLTRAKADSRNVNLSVTDDTRHSQGKESYLVVESAGAAVEIFEQSGVWDRPATRLALAEIKRELESALRPAPLSAEIAANADSKTTQIELAKGMQGGIYFVRAFVNPGESGKAYLKVFEATKNKPLSTSRIKDRSTARTGFSSNSAERFPYQCEMTIYEGGWGAYYPARFELWFAPDSGKPERKLAERIFRVEGWQR